MFKTLFSKILVITIAFTLLIITQLGLSAAYIVRSHYISDIKQELTRESNYINGIVCTEYLDTRNYSSAKEKLLTASRQYGAALQLIFRDDPVMNADIIDQQCAEVWRIVPLADVGAFAQNIMKSNDIYGYYFDIFSGISENRSLTVSRLIQSGDGLVIGVMLIHYDMTGIYATLKTLYFDIFAAVLIALLIAGTIAFIIAGMKVGEPYFFALYFPNFIINTFAAISTTGAIYFISRKLKNTQILCFLSNVGRLSLLLLCIHGIDYILKGTNTFVYTLCSLNGRVANLIYDIMLIAMPVIATFIFARVVFVRKIFNIK